MKHSFGANETAPRAMKRSLDRFHIFAQNKGKKNGGGLACESKLNSHFYNSLIAKDSHKDTGILFKNSVLKQAKMVTIYQRKILDTTTLLFISPLLLL